MFVVILGYMFICSFNYFGVILALFGLLNLILEVLGLIFLIKQWRLVDPSLSFGEYNSSHSTLFTTLV